MMHKRKKYFLTLAVITALLNTSYAGVAAAEEADSQQAVEQVQTRDVVVTASRTEQLVKEAPAAVEVITREDLDKMGAENLAQALQLAIGIDVSENGMVGNSVVIRGAKSNQTLIMVDGMRIRTENTDQTANNYELQRVNMADVERIEIVRGATSSLYGADAMGGLLILLPRHQIRLLSLFLLITLPSRQMLASEWPQASWANGPAVSATNVVMYIIWILMVVVLNMAPRIILM